MSRVGRIYTAGVGRGVREETYTVNGISIKTSEEVAFLGVILTSDVS
jgi:hypothetical protein